MYFLIAKKNEGKFHIFSIVIKNKLCDNNYIPELLTEI